MQPPSLQQRAFTILTSNPSPHPTPNGGSLHLTNGPYGTGWVFAFSDRAAIGVEINDKARHWLEYSCNSTLKPNYDMSLILIHCALLKESQPIGIPEESTIQCVKTINDPKKRLVMFSLKHIIFYKILSLL